MTTTTTTLAGAAALLALAALATPAQAGLFLHASDALWTTTDPTVACAGQASVGQAVQCIDPCGREAAGNLCGLGRGVEGWCDGDCHVGDPTVDRNHNLVPDSLEGNVCGRSLTRGVSMHAETAATCRTHGEMAGLPDEDRDGIPDAFEPTICQAEDDGTDLDGSCDATATDYTL